MLNINNLFNNYFSLTVRLVLLKALLFFLIWKFVFIFFLRETKLIDHPLTTHIGEYSTKLLNSFVDPPTFVVKREFIKSSEISQIYNNNRKVVYVADGCNALELMVGYIGFIFCLPSGFWRKVLYIVLGILAIHSINIIRIAGLIYVNEFHQVHFDFTHLYLFKAIMYSFTFAIWMLYMRKIEVKRVSAQIR